MDSLAKDNDEGLASGGHHSNEQTLKSIQRDQRFLERSNHICRTIKLHHFRRQFKQLVIRLLSLLSQRIQRGIRNLSLFSLLVQRRKRLFQRTDRFTVFRKQLRGIFLRVIPANNHVSTKKEKKKQKKKPKKKEGKEGKLIYRSCSKISWQISCKPTNSSIVKKKE
jgi:hypothetical protein